MPGGLGGMGTGSDTRIYNPRSESSHMYRHNHEEDTYSPADGKEKDLRREKRLKEKEDREREMKRLKHVKIKRSDLESLPMEDEKEDEADKFDRELEPSLMTGSAGSRGFLTSIASQAKGPGAAHGHAFAMGEPMEIAFQLLKRDERQGFVGGSERTIKKPKSRTSRKKDKKDAKERSKKWRPSTGQFKMPPGGMTPSSATSRRAKARMRGIKGSKKSGLGRAHLAVEMSHRGIKTKQPMSKDPMRYRQYSGQQEARKRLGGIRTTHSTPPRFGTRSYKAGQTGAGLLQSLLPGQAQQMRRPALKPHRPPPLIPPRMPHAPSLPSPSIPSPPPIPQVRSGVGVQNMAQQEPMFTPSKLPTSSVQGLPPAPVMTGEIGEGSDIQKKGLSYYDIAELRQLVNDARRALKEKERKKKGMGEKNVGASTNLPKHTEAGPKQTTRPEGVTEDATNEPRTFGINPFDHLTSRGGRTP